MLKLETQFPATQFSTRCSQTIKYVRVEDLLAIILCAIPQLQSQCVNSTGELLPSIKITLVKLDPKRAPNHRYLLAEVKWPWLLPPTIVSTLQFWSCLMLCLHFRVAFEVLFYFHNLNCKAGFTTCNLARVYYSFFFQQQCVHWLRWLPSAHSNDLAHNVQELLQQKYDSIIDATASCFC